MTPSQRNFSLIVITGPTASGKSELALEVAHQNEGELICADSRQIYRDLNIGTAKPTAAEQALVRHHLFDIADPRETFTVSQYLQAVHATLQDIWQRGKLPILVGGTGLYIKSLLYDYQIPAVPPQTALRQALLAEEAYHGEGWLYRQLQLQDAETAARLSPRDLRRIIRALEVQAVTGQPLSKQQQRSPELRYSCLYIGLQLPRSILEERIRRRIDTMMASGLVAEVRYLQQKYGSDLPLLQTLNYRETADYLAGRMTLEESCHAMFIHTRQYAKRQMTWFRKDPGLHWIECPTGDLEPARIWLRQQGLYCATQTGIVL